MQPERAGRLASFALHGSRAFSQTTLPKTPLRTQENKPRVPVMVTGQQIQVIKKVFCVPFCFHSASLEIL